MRYAIKLFAKTSLAFSLDAQTRVPPAELSFGSDIEAEDTMRRPDVTGAGGGVFIAAEISEGKIISIGAGISTEETASVRTELRGGSVTSTVFRIPPDVDCELGPTGSEISFFDD